MSWVLVVIAMASGIPPQEYRYPMPDRDACINALVSATYSKSMINTAFTAFCVPKEEGKG